MAKKRRQKANLFNFKTIDRSEVKYRLIEERVKDYKNLLLPFTIEHIKGQASRCQNCGVPFCHGYGCPLENLIPDWNNFVYKDKWFEASEQLHSTNNFPEFTGRICPAPCEESCTLNVTMDSVTIRDIEFAIIDKAFEENWIKPILPEKLTGKKIAVIGSGPAGLTASQELARKGHSVTLFEKDEKVGGFLRYGIPDFKLEKSLIDRRVNQLIEEGVEIETGVDIGHDITVRYLLKKYDAIVLAVGSRKPRDLNIKGRELRGTYFATDYLIQANQMVDGIEIPKDKKIDVKDKKVIVIGGGDTGADCVGTANRQGAKSIKQLEILPKPSKEREESTPWPMYANKLRTSSSHKEGVKRKWSIATKEIIGKYFVKRLRTTKVEWKKDENNKWIMTEVENSTKKIDADIILLAMGFEHPIYSRLLKELEVELDNKGNIKTSNHGYGKTSVEKVFAAGDASRGASLVVWAIAHGRMVAKEVDDYLMG